MPKKSVEQQIEDLALMVGRGFEELRKDLTKRLNAIDSQLERIEFSVSAHDRRLSTLEDRVLQLAKKTGLTFN